MGPFNQSVYKMFPRLPAAPTWQSQTNLSPINIVEYDLMGNNFGLPFWQAGSPELVQAKSWKCKYYSDWSLAIITADITEGGQSVLAWASPIKTPDNINNISTQISWPSSLPKKDQVKRFLPRLNNFYPDKKCTRKTNALFTSQCQPPVESFYWQLLPEHRGTMMWEGNTDSAMKSSGSGTLTATSRIMHLASRGKLVWRKQVTIKVSLIPVARSDSRCSLLHGLLQAVEDYLLVR